MNLSDRAWARSSWLVGWDTPEALQFGAFVGHEEGFAPTNPAEAAVGADARLEDAWRGWWEGLVGRTFGAHFDAVSKEAPVPPHERTAELQTARMREAMRRAQLDFYPPAFPELAQLPALQELLQRHWPAFQGRWNAPGGWKAELEEPQPALIGAINLRQIVAECARQAGHVAAPFSLRIDLLWWPEDYERRVSAEQLVLGLGFLQPENRPALEERLHQAIAALV